MTRCSTVMSVFLFFGQHCWLSGPVGFLQFREPCAIKPAACRAVRDTGVLQIGDRVYMVSMNTTQPYTEYEGGHPPICRDRRAKLHGEIHQATLEVTLEQEWAKVEKLDTTVITSMGTVVPAADEGKTDAAKGTKGQTFRYRFENRLFQFGPESALLGLIERISFDNTNSGKNSFFVSFLVEIGRFVECLLLYCFDITGQWITPAQ